VGFLLANFSKLAEMAAFQLRGSLVGGSALKKEVEYKNELSCWSVFEYFPEVNPCGIIE